MISLWLQCDDGASLCYLIVHLFKAESGRSSINHRSCFLQHQVSRVTLNHNRSNICIKCSTHGCKRIWMPLVLAQGLRKCLTSVTRCQRFFSTHRTSHLLRPSSVYSVFFELHCSVWDRSSSHDCSTHFDLITVNTHASLVSSYPSTIFMMCFFFFYGHCMLR